MTLATLPGPSVARVAVSLVIGMALTWLLVTGLQALVRHAILEGWV